MSKIAWGMGISVCVHAFIVAAVAINPADKKEALRANEPLVISVNSFIQPEPPSIPKVREVQKPKEPEPKKIPKIKEPKPKVPEPKNPIVPKPEPPKPIEPKPIIKPEKPKPQKVVPQKKEPKEIVPQKIESKEKVAPKETTPKEKMVPKEEIAPAPEAESRASKDFNLPPMDSNLRAQADKVQMNTQKTISSNPARVTNTKGLPTKAEPAKPTWDTSSYLKEVKEAIIRHKSYPLRARKTKMQGEVAIVFSILPTGEIVGLNIEKSSGYKYLDSHTLETIKEASSVFPKPVEKIKVQIPIEYRLF